MKKKSLHRNYIFPHLLLLIICTAAIMVAFFPYSFGAYDEFASEVLNITHLPAFAIFTLTLFFSLSRRFGNWRYLITIIISIVLAIAIEWIQARIGRDASWQDVAFDATGITLALCGVYLWQKTDKTSLHVSYIFFSFCVIALLSYPVAIKGYSIYWQKQQFPILGNFENEMDLYSWHPQGGKPDNPTRIELWKNSETGNQALRIITGQGDWGGVSFLAYDEDWSNFKYFSLDVFNPDTQPFRFFIRIDDSDKRAIESYKHRFNHLQMIHPGMNKIRIPIHTIVIRPKSRNLNIRSIRRLILYLEENAPSRIFYIDNIRLE